MPAVQPTALAASRFPTCWRHALLALTTATLAACGGGGGGADTGATVQTQTQAAAEAADPAASEPAPPVIDKTISSAVSPVMETPVPADFVPVVDGGAVATTESAQAVWSPVAVAADTQWTRIADEGFTVNFPQPRQVRFGTDGAWIVKTGSGAVKCDSATFGYDPARGVRKRCETTTVWTRAATENGGFNVASPRRVRYGVGSDWIIRTVSGWVPCTSAFFGDAKLYTAKTCEIENTPVPMANSTQLGVYTGNRPADLTRFENWLGRSTDGVHMYAAVTSWNDMAVSAQWSVSNWENSGRTVFWSVPLLVYNTNLESAAAGAYDAHYRRVAQVLVNFQRSQPRLNVRLGWEFNGNWFNWNATKGRHTLYIQAYRRAVAAFRQVAKEAGVPNRFQFEWNVAIGAASMNPADGYPGDDVVDVIGGDFYWDQTWDPVDPAAAWNHMLNRQYGLLWHQKFAAAHRKPTSYSEWGVKGNNAGPYIERARDFFAQYPVLFHSYWDSTSVYNGMMSNNQYPAASAAWRAAFLPR